MIKKVILPILILAYLAFTYLFITYDNPDKLRYCSSESDCMMVSRYCNCSGLGEDTINKWYVPVWYYKKSYNPFRTCECPLVMPHHEGVVLCEDNRCRSEMVKTKNYPLDPNAFTQEVPIAPEVVPQDDSSLDITKDLALFIDFEEHDDRYFYDLSRNESYQFGANHILNTNSHWRISANSPTGHAVESYDGVKMYLRTEEELAIDGGKSAFTYAALWKIADVSDTNYIGCFGRRHSKANGTWVCIAQIYRYGFFAQSRDTRDCPSNFNPQENKWYYVTVVQKAQGIAVYVDGQRKGKCPFVFDIDVSRPDYKKYTLGTGNFDQASEGHWWVDNIAIWNRALSRKEIMALSSRRGVVYGDDSVSD